VPALLYYREMSAFDALPNDPSAGALQIDRIREADVSSISRGTDGALPSVVAGLVESPVIAVPTG